MNFRLKIAAWFSFSLLVLLLALGTTAHLHLDEELRKDRWDRSHPEFPNWVIHGSYTDEEVGDILRELIQTWLIVGIPLLVASVGIGYFIAARSVRPIRLINRELANLSPDLLHGGISSPEKDKELSELVAQINGLLGRVGDYYQEMAEFSGRVAHELRTPITLLRMRLEESAEELPEDFSEDMQEEVRRLSQLVERSLLAAKAERGKLEIVSESVDLTSLLADLEEDYGLLAEERSIPMDWRVSEGLVCHTDRDLIRQILHNLLGNAVHHGASRVRLTARKSRTGRHLSIVISNFIPTENPATPGTGMGLRLVRNLTIALAPATFRNRNLHGVYSVRLVLVAG